jgi:hypothetical protein
MKKISLTALFATVALLANAQIFVDGTQIGPSNTGQYLELDPMFREDGRCAFRIDYGQRNPKESYVTDSRGIKYDFLSLVDGLNFFYSEGWEVSQVFVTDKGRRFLLKRRF